MARSSAHADTVEIDAADRDTLAIRGALTFATAQRACADGERALAAGSQTNLDLAGVVHADSAGLACVVALAAAANRAGRRLRVVALPEGLRALAEVCGVAALLEPEARPAA
ncbi:MAG TPA: STAS domain-containing protein [Rhodanobacteraceae bacterium]|jgi:phospholipid transport system transporter-binding protein|nr:STAS domain-containing protein [Rhodanobacteraceae bacterium]